MANKKKIFIITNDRGMIEILENYLVKEGHQVKKAPDAFNALDILNDYHPQIIFIDRILPNLDGERLTRLIREMPQFKSCHIVILSATLAEENLNLEAIGANSAIVKGPFSLMSRYIAETLEEADIPVPIAPTVKGLGDFSPRHITKELLDQNRRLEKLLESISQGIIELESHRILYANQSAIDFLHTTREALIGSFVDELPEHNLRDILNQGVSACCSPSLYEENNILVNVIDKQLLVNCLRLDSQANKKIVLLTDITDRKRMEAFVEATNLTKNLGYIFSGIRHEIGNPVNSIKMALTVLQKNINTYDRTTISEFISRSLEEVARLEYLLRALKNYSLFEKPVIQNTSIEHFLQNFVPLVKEDMERRGIKIRTDIQKNALTAMTDSRALHHVLLNLITNAADAVVDRQSPSITLSAERQSAGIVIKVDDNGCGIAKDDLSHIFAPFFTSKPQGTGLGLAIVEKMLTSMNGQIAIDSIREFGTTVTITLPEKA